MRPLVKNKFIKVLIENLLNLPYRMYFHLRALVKSKNKNSKKYYVSICAIFKNESKYLFEWIEYHKILGVDHIYLYDNNSEDNFYEIIDPYISEGFITLKSWPMEHGQMEAYSDCYNLNKDETQWLALIDLDEFICPYEETDIKNWLIEFEAYPAVILYWQMFGTNGKIKPDYEKLVIEQYTNSWLKLDGVGKVIINTDKNFEPTRLYHHHIYFRYKLLFFNIKVPMINEHKKFIFFPQIYKAPEKNTIQLNHYWSKSFGEYSAKINKGDVFSNENFKTRQNLDFFFWHEHKNISENKIIWRFLIKLKLQVKKLNNKLE